MPWFDQAPWLVALAPFFGLFLSAFAKRTDPFIAGDRVYRHDAPARLSHWTHGIGTAVCLASGIVLGLRFTPAFVEDGPAAILWQNVHFAAAIVFLFGTFYYLGNTIISKWRLREHLPTKNVVAYTVRHYGLLVGIKKFTMPPEDKYFESEKAAYVMAVVTAALLVVTGLVKALAHVVLTLPDGLMNVMFWVHDIAAALMLLFLAAHVFFAVIAPFSWKTFPSMLIGWMPRAEVEWSYGSIFSERDINEHGVHNAVYNTSIMAVLTGAEPPVSAENMAKQLADQSGLGDPLCFDWSEEGIYSDARVREIHWNRAYGRFWLQSLGMCDWVWPNFISRKHTAETGSTYGATPEYEVKFFQAVTGRDLSYEESIELGHKFWVLDRAIWALEGRHRDQEVFTNYVYDVKTTKPFPLVVFEDGKWSYSLCQGRTLDRDKFEDFKTRFYAHEGFEESTGRPTRSGLEALGLGFAADKLEAAGKLGA